jgi:polysaccharide export outer membrane protein
MIRLVLCALALATAAAGQEKPTAPAGLDVDSYRLKPNDLVSLSVFEEPDLSTRTRILKTGEGVFPLIGTVKIGGVTVAGATRLIRDLYARDYLVDPKVTLTVDEYATEFVSVVGAVASPGQVPIPVSGNLDLSSALAAAGGLAPHADPNRINVVRASGATSTFSQSSIQSGGGIALAAGDRIVVYESSYMKKSVTILGQVRQPGQVDFPLDGRLDLLTAISRAGGFTELASRKKIAVNRGGKTIFFDMREGKEQVSKEFLLQPDDIITVAERIF